MAYPNGAREVVLASASGDTDILASGTGEKTRNWFGYQAHVVKAVGVVSTITATKATNPIFSVRASVSAGNGTTSATGMQFKTITLASGDNRGTWYIADKLNKEIPPGGELILHVTTAATLAQKCRAVAWVVPVFNTPANLTGQVGQVSVTA